LKTTVKLAVAFFAYGGNGGVSSVIPELVLWWGDLKHKLLCDHRFEKVGAKIYSDTPIYMTRNRAVRDAIDGGYDLLLMVDSDNEPDAYLGKDPEAKAFFGEPFDFVFDRLVKGIPTVMMAPYCGPPPHPLVSRNEDGGEVPYLFQWTNRESDNPNDGYHQAMLTRAEAERLRGIYPVSSGPTGLSLFTLNVFNGPPRPYFDYEHDPDKCEKRGTEDCYATRNLSLYWKIKHGHDVCYAACDSWALHHKPKRVGKPRTPTLETVSEDMRAALTGNSRLDEQRHISYDISTLPRRGRMLLHDEDTIYLTDEDLRVAKEVAAQEGYDAA